MQQQLLGICGVEEACKCWNQKKNRLDCTQTQSLSSSWVIGSRLLTAARFGRSLLYTPTHHNRPHPHHTQATVTIGASMRLEKALKWDVQVPGLGAGG